MARRLNKKVALIGSVFFMLFVVAVVLVVLHLSRSPEYFIEDGDAALEAGDYKKAEKSYLRAKSRADDDELRVEMLHKLIDIYLETEQWPPARGCWQGVIQIEPDNIPIRYVQLKYYYVVADSGAGGLWRDVEVQASELLEIVEREGLLDEPISQWELPIYEKVGITHPSFTAPGKAQRIGPYLYTIRGRAKLNVAQSGGVTNPERMLDEAIADLKKALELDPAGVPASLYYAQAVITKGQLLASRGSFEQRELALKESIQILRDAVKASPQDPRGHIHLLLTEMRANAPQQPTRDWLKQYEQRYLELVEKFPSEPQVYAALSNFYNSRGPDYIDKAVEVIETARKLAPNNATYSFSAANLRYMRFSISGGRSDLDSAISILKEYVDSPAVQETSGPRQIRNINNKARLYSYLATIYIEQLLASDGVETDAQKQQWIAESEKAVHELEQVFGSGENPQVMKWQGMLDLVKGNRNDGIRKLYAAYEQLKASGQVGSQLAYILAKSFENTKELGAANEFWAAALRLRPEDRGDRQGSIDRRKPTALLDCAQLWLKLRNTNGVLNVVNYFESLYGANSRSKQLKVAALIETGDIDKAQEELEQAELDEPNDIKFKIRLALRRVRDADVALKKQQLGVETDQALLSPTSEQEPVREPVDSDKLRAQREKDYELITALIRKLLAVEPNSVPDSLIVQICNYHKERGQADQAEQFARQFLVHFPENINVRLFLEMFAAGPNPSEEFVTELNYKVRNQITNPKERSVSLGLYYLIKNDPNKALEQFMAVIEPYLKDVEAQPQKEFTKYEHSALAHLTDLSMQLKDWPLAQKITQLARVRNLDGCQGTYFRAMLAFAQEKYEQSLQLVNESLELRPVFSEAYALKARINASLGKDDKSIEDFKTAAYLNPLDGNIRRALAFALYQRNEKLGDNLTSDQRIEATQALERALALNPDDTRLLGFYADYIGSSEPERALAIRQRLYKAQPSVLTAVQLGNLASEIAISESDQKEKEALFAIAEEAYQQALSLEPGNTGALYNYAEYLRSRGKYKEAENLLGDVKEEQLLGLHYFNTGQMDKAKQICEQIVQADPGNAAILKMLVTIGERAGSQEDVEKYSQVLLEVEDNLDNRLMQIQSYLTVGLTQQAKLKLQSFREKNPQDPRGQILAAWISMREGKLDEALELVKRSLEIDEANPVAWRLKGQINSLLANYNQAILDLNKSKSITDDPITRTHLARAYVSANRTRDAIMELAAIMDDPKTPMAPRLLLERIYSLSENNDALRNFYISMLKMFPDDVIWLNKTANFAAEHNDFANAEKLGKRAWEKSLEMGQPNPSSLEFYLDSLLQRGQFDKLITEAGKQINTTVAPVAYAKMAEAKVKMGDKEAAVDLFRKAVDTVKTDQTLASNILRGMYSTLGADEVKKYCNQKLQEAPNSLAVNYVLYQMSKVGGDYNKAVTYLDKVTELVGPATEQGLNYRNDKAELLFGTYLAYSDNSYLNRAIEVWQELLEDLPDNASLLNNLAYAFISADRQPQKALDYIERALEISPDNPRFLDTAAYVLYKNGRFKEAEEHAQASVQQFELQEAYAPAEVYEHIGMIKEKLDATDEAVAAYRKALELGQQQYSEEQIGRINNAIERLSR